MTMIDRRKVLVGGATLIASAPALARSAARDPLAGRIVINALGGLGDPNHPQDGLRPDLSQRVLADARRSGLSAVNITLGHVAGPGDPFELSVADIAATDAMLRRFPHQLVKVLTAADIRRAAQSGRIGVIYGFQNAAMLGSDPARVDLFADLGVRVFQLTYNPANALGDGSMAPSNRGLSALGHDMIARLNKARVMIDLSHSGERTCLEAARLSAQPISINHTGCRALTDLPRNKTDAELRLVAERGGFVGIYFMPFLSPSGHARAEDVVAHILHALKVCGEDHVGIGTDGGTTPIADLQAYQAVLAREIAARRAAGMSATGERPDTYPFVVDLRGPDQFRQLAHLLKAKGLPPRVIDKVLGLNFLAHAKQVWGS